MASHPVALTDDQRRSVTEMMREHGPGLWRIAVVVAGSAHAAEDLLATAVLRALPHLDTITVPAPHYLRRVMLNLRATAWRRGLRITEHAQAKLPDGPATDDPAEMVALRADVAAALAALAPRQRAVVVLRYMEDRSIAEVARILDCTEVTVRSQSHRALAHLRRHAPHLLEDPASSPRSTP